ncbi:MAG: FAD:protein FMN transferase, partial [bacterium]
MIQQKIFVVILVVTHLVSPAAKSADKPAEYHFSHENILGTSLDLRVAAENLNSARLAESAVLASIERQAKVYSTYDASSELSRLQQRPVGEAVRASAGLRRMLSHSQLWNERTAGAFDVRIESLSRLWSNASKTGQMPTHSEIQGVLAKIGRTQLLVDDEAETIKRTGDAPITFNAIATGTIIDEACREVLAGGYGVFGLMIDIGGDIRVAGEMESLIGVAHPRGTSENAAPIARLKLKNQAVTTSGDLFKGFVISGKQFSHIIDPVTGRPVENVTSATVIAPTAEDADALATAFNVMPAEKSIALADSLEGVACLMVTADGRLLVSRDWARYTTGGSGFGNLLTMAMTG